MTDNAQYTAMTLIAPRTLERQQRPRTDVPAHHVRVQVQMAGVCGTDLAIYQGQYEVPLPLVMGHEFCGVVSEVGAEVSEHWLGRRVVAEINNSCLALQSPDPCPECQESLPNHCRRRTVIGIVNADGGFAESMIAPVRNLHPLPDSVDDRTAVFVEPMAAALQTFVLRPLEAQETVVVLGTGRLGLLIVAAAKSKGVTVIAISRSEQKRRFATMFGADHVLDPQTEDLPTALRALNNDRLADVVVEATGNPEILHTAVPLVRPRGTLCLKTTSGVPSSIDLTNVVVDEIQLSSSRCGPFAPAIRFLDQHELPLEAWITETYPLAQLGTAMQAAKAPGKVLIAYPR